MEPAILRIKNDLKEIRFGNCINTIGYAVQKEGYPFIVEACVIGPRSTRYEDELLIFEFQFSNDYPVKKQTFLHHFIYFIFSFSLHHLQLHLFQKQIILIFC